MSTQRAPTVSRSMRGTLPVAAAGVPTTRTPVPWAGEAAPSGSVIVCAAFSP
jgi:hypothetical protein